MDILRTDTAKQYKNIRRILRSDNTEPHTQPICNVKWIVVGIVLVCIGLMLLFQGCAQAYTPDQAVKAVIGEAENQGQTGMNAVACAIGYRGSLNGVYGLRSYRVTHHKYSLKTANMAKLAVLQSHDGQYCMELVHGAQYWASTIYDKKWINIMDTAGYIRTAYIGQQVFYRKG